jgi:acid phosphatase
MSVLWTACASTGVETTPHENRPRLVETHELLNAVLWTQTSVEYRAVAIQSYRRAEEMLDRALEDPSWTAALEQTGDLAGLPPAVILDVDETVLDNTPYEVRLIEQNLEYATDTWNAWCNEAAAIAVPGALEFTRYAARRGVTVFYVTNRRHVVEDATRRNLDELGFPLESDLDTLQTRGEKPEWGSDKGPRRREIASRYRILLSIGDNLGDFVSGEEAPIEERDALAKRYSEYWGTRWIVLPNPQYGSWEGALYEYDFGLSREEKLRLKMNALRKK